MPPSDSNADVKLFLNKAIQELAAIRVARNRYASKLAPDFNCFDYIEPDEMGLSRVVADLLDPNGAHAQGGKFLAMFLRRTGLDDWAERAESAVVGTEVPTFKGRRVDIEIRWDDRALIIENKPWAADQKAQLRDYAEYLRSRMLGQWHLIYLSGNGALPSEDSMSASEQKALKVGGHFNLITYHELLPWLTDCMAQCGAERVRWFLGEFTGYIRATFLGERDMQERQAMVELALESKDHLQAALEVTAAVEDVKIKLLQILESQLAEKIKDRAGWYLDYDVTPSKSYSGFSIYFLPKQRYVFSCEFEGTGLSQWIFGISKDGENVPDSPEITTRMNDSGLGQGKSTKWWPWWVYFEADVRDWRTNVKPWLGIQDGSLAEMILEKADAVYAAFEKDGKLDLLK